MRVRIAKFVFFKINNFIKKKNVLNIINLKIFKIFMKKLFDGFFDKEIEFFILIYIFIFEIKIDNCLKIVFFYIFFKTRIIR